MPRGGGTARAALALSFLLAAPLSARTPDDADLVIKYERADLVRVIADIAKKIDGRYLFDREKLGGSITITGYDKVNRAEARELLHAALLLRGFAVLPTPGGIWRIAPISEATAISPWQRLSDELGEGEAPVTTLVRLRAAGAEEVLSVIQPWLASGAVAMAFEPTNSLILAGSELRLRTLLRVVRYLDEAALVELARVELSHRAVEEIAPLVREVFGGRNDDYAQLQALDLWVDARTNSLIFRGSPAMVEDVREFLARIDRRPMGGGRVVVIPVQHVPAAELAALLQSLAQPRATPAARAPDGEAPATGGAASADDLADGEVLVGRSFNLAVDEATNALVASGEPDALRLLAEVAAELDRAPPLVTLDILVFELRSSQPLRLAVDFSVLTTDSLDPDFLGSVTSLPSGDLTSPDAVLGGSPDANALARYTRIAGLVPIVDDQGNVTFVEIASRDGVVTALARDVETRVLIRPHLTMVSGTEHELFVGDNVPIPRARSDASGTPFQTVQDIERQDVGLRLSLRPTVGERGGLNLDVSVERTDVVESAAGPVEEVGPTVQQRRIESTLALADGQLGVVGGLREQRTATSVVRVPFLGSIPLLGALFRSTRSDPEWVHLYVAVTPRILRGESSLLAETIRRRLGFERALARTAGIAASPESPFAVLVATRGRADDAESIAQGLDSEAHPARVVSWKSGEEERFDVYVTGFANLVDAGDLSLRLRTRGWSPEVIALPDPASDPTL